mgnify:CR=1 FL=1
MKRFALVGVGGYIAPRHLKAIQDTGHTLVAALDKSDSVGIIDRYFPQAHFFVEFERFDRHLELLRREGKGIDYLTVCSPNYLHDAHVRFGLRHGADVICEKPLAINPWNIKGLMHAEKESENRVSTILQLRIHPSILALKKEIDEAPKDKIFDIDLTYITSRGRWYLQSWKGDVSKSGGITCNIGIHFFDMLLWIFGGCKKSSVHLHNPRKAAGFLQLERANVRWFLSIDSNDLPFEPEPGQPMTHRSIQVDGKAFDFAKGFTDLHTESYKKIFNNEGFGLEDAFPSIELTASIRTAKEEELVGDYHPMVKKIKQG